MRSMRLDLGRTVIWGAAILIALSAVGCDEESAPRGRGGPSVVEDGSGSRTNGQVSLAPCKPSHLQITVVGGAGISGGGVFIGVHIEHGRYRACLLRGPMTVALLDPSGKPLPIRGNPLRRTVAFRMSRRSSVSADMGWVGWCGTQERVELTAAVAGVRDRAMIRPPPCDPEGELGAPPDGGNEGSRSTLGPLRQPRWLYGVGGAAQIGG